MVTDRGVWFEPQGQLVVGNSPIFFSIIFFEYIGKKKLYRLFLLLLILEPLDTGDIYKVEKDSYHLNL